MKNIKKLLSLTVAVVAVGAVFTSCDSLFNGNGDGDTGTLSVLLTDAPFPTDLVESAYVTIDSVVIHAMHIDEFITLSSDPAEYDLMELRNGETALLADLDIPTGEYNQIRLLVNDDSARVVLKEGPTLPLTVPSGEKSGLKINILPHLSIGAGTTGEVLLDFDVSKSFTMQYGQGGGAITGFHFKPVVRAVNLASAGKLHGTVTDASLDTLIADAQVSISSPDSVLTTTFTNTSGAYAFLGIPVGTYTVEAAAFGYNSKTESVAVDEEGWTVQNFKLIPQ